MFVNVIGAIIRQEMLYHIQTYLIICLAQGIFMHVSNELDFGHLVNPESYDVSRTHPDMYQLFDNKIEWEQRYLHEDYAASFQEGYKPLMVMSALDMT